LGGTPAAATSPLVQNLIDQINSGSLTYDQALVQAKSYGKNVQQQLINGYKVQTPSGGGVAGFSYNDGSLLPKDDPNVYQTDPTINGTPAQVYMDGINYALKGATALSGLGLGQANQVKNYRQSVKAKGDALAMAAGTTTAQLQQDFTASGTALKSQVTFLNNTERALNGAEQSSNIVQRIFQENNLNTADSTYLNMKVNDFVKQFGSSGEIRAYQAGMTEVGNEYAQVFARGGQRNQTIDQRALDITDGNLKLSDMQDTLTSLQAVGGRVVKTSQDQINNIDAGGDLANFYSYIYGGYSGQGGGTTGQGSVSTMSNQDLLNSIPGL
jgi:hypothetical protein